MIKSSIIFSVVAVFLMIPICFLSGCSDLSVYESAYQAGAEKAEQVLGVNTPLSGNFFELVAKDSMDTFCVFRDLRTDVLYCWHKGGYGGGMTVMLAPDGSPLLYSEWLEMQPVD